MCRIVIRVILVILLCLIAAYSLVTYCDAKFEAGDYKKDSYIDMFCFEVQ